MIELASIMNKAIKKTESIAALKTSVRTLKNKNSSSYGYDMNKIETRKRIDKLLGVLFDVQ